MEVLPDGRVEHIFHQSWLNTYFTCPEQARAVMTHEYPRDESDAGARGDAVHAAIEAVVRDLAQPDEALSIAFKTFRDLAALPEFRYVKTKTESTCLRHIEGYFASWWDYVYPGLGPSVWIEHKFRDVVYEDEDRVIYWGGTVDYAEQGRITDWKTTQNKDKYGTKFGQDGWEQQRWSLQPTFYDNAYLRAFGSIPMFDFVVLDSKGNRPQVLSIERTQGQIDFLVFQCLQIAQFIEKQGTDGLWPLRDQHALCSERWCLKWADCKGGFLDAPVSIG